MRPVIAGLALLVSASWPVVASAFQDRPFTAADLLSQEGLGATRISPDGRWVAVETRRAYDSAPSYRLGFGTPWLLTDLHLLPVANDADTIVLASRDGDVGHVSGPFSPSGRRMVVYRVTDRALQLGVLTLADRNIDWFDLTPEISPRGRAIAWRSDDVIVLIARPADDLPIHMRIGSKVQDRVSELWGAAASGQRSSAVAIYSGAMRDQRVQAEP